MPIPFSPLSPPQAGKVDPFFRACEGTEGRELHSPARKRGDKGATQKLSELLYLNSPVFAWETYTRWSIF